MLIGESGDGIIFLSSRMYIYVSTNPHMYIVLITRIHLPPGQHFLALLLSAMNTLIGFILFNLFSY